MWNRHWREGLAGIVFLEHLECGIDYFERTWLTDDDFVIFRREADRLKEKYAGRIEVLCGIEVGYNPKDSRPDSFLSGPAAVGQDRPILSLL